MFRVFLFCAFLLPLASPLSVCRLSLTERVTCPDDFYCCGVDQCCKLTFQNESNPSNDDPMSFNQMATKNMLFNNFMFLFMNYFWNIIKGSLNEWMTDFCVRAVIVTAFMVMLFVTGVSLRFVRNHYFGKCCPEINLPRYRPLEKNSIASNLDNISTLIGTPFYHVNSDQVGVLRGGSIAAVPV